MELVWSGSALSVPELEAGGYNLAHLRPIRLKAWLSNLTPREKSMSIVVA